MAPTAIPFGKYLLLRRIAVGGMAEVFLAKTFGVEGFEKLLAVKRILPSLGEDSEFIQMFIDEAKISGQLTHPGIVPIYELGKQGDAHYIAMEYVWGRDLLQVINRMRKLRQKMHPAMAAFIAARMAEALDYAHNKKDANGNPLNIIHRDVSPQNILVTYDGGVKLIDFGIAKAAARQTQTQAGVLKGKFGYMSPEQVMGETLDPRSDVFAVGTCLYELLICDRLFAESNDLETLERIRTADVQPIEERLPSIPPELARILKKTLSKDRDDRYASAADLQDDLETFVVSTKPLIAEKQLASWMAKNFSEIMNKEKALLDSYKGMSLPGDKTDTKPKSKPRIPPPPPPVPLPITKTDGEIEPGELVFDELEGAVAIEELPDFEEDDATMVYFSATDTDATSSKPPATSGPAPAPTPGPAPVPAPAPRLPAPIPAPQVGPAPSINDLQSSDPPGVTVPPARQRRIQTVEISRSRFAKGLRKQKNSPLLWVGVVLFALAVAWLAWDVFINPGDPGDIEVRTIPPVRGALVIIDGERRGTAPLRIEQLSAGEHQLDVVAPGYRPQQREIKVESLRTKAIDIVMIKQ